MNTINRPGITSQYLASNKIEHVNAEEAKEWCGCRSDGLIIPYYDSQAKPIFDPEDTHYCRLRKDNVTSGHKYHQPAGTSVHAYLPANWRTSDPGGDLAIIEGEFKSMSLTDPNQVFTFPCVAISGFFGFHLGRDDEDEPFSLTLEVAEALKTLKPQRIVFIGDNDTSLNHDFSVAAIRLKSLLRGTTVALLRINLDEPKGIDDCRGKLHGGFENWFQDRLETVVEVQPDMTADALALNLLEPQIPLIQAMQTTEKEKAFKRLVTLMAKTGGPARVMMMNMLKKPLAVGKTELNKMVEHRLRELAESDQADRFERIREQISSQFFYDGHGYYKGNENGPYFPLNGRDNILLHLEQEYDLPDKDAKTGLYLIQSECRVSFAGNIAGHKAGIYDSGTTRILVTNSPNPVNAEQGAFGQLSQFLEEFFGKGQNNHWELQLNTFLGYLHYARLALKSPEAAFPGQVLFLLGAHGIGKTLIQEKIITPLIGGRQADPCNYLLQKTNFNDDLIGAEHLCMSDAEIDSSQESIRRFRNQLKRQVANPTQAWTKKYATTAYVQPLQRMTISANLDKASLSIIPTLDESIRDKMSLLKCYRPKALPSSDINTRQRFIQLIEESLPGLAYHIDRFLLPNDLKDDRFGVGSFHHPDILKATAQTDPLVRLKVYLGKLLKEQDKIDDTAKNLWNTMNEKFGEEFLEMADSPSQLGKYFSQLKLCPDWAGRIDKSEKQQYGDQGNYATVWKIT